METAVILAQVLATQNPERYPKDKFKGNNDGSIRAFETHSYRIAYRFNAGEISVLRARHVKKEPGDY